MNHEDEVPVAMPRLMNHQHMRVHPEELGMIVPVPIWPEILNRLMSTSCPRCVPAMFNGIICTEHQQDFVRPRG